MDTRLAASFHVPPASLQAIPDIMLVALVPAYEAAFVPAMRRLTGVATGITPLQRIGVGLFAVTFSMVAPRSSRPGSTTPQPRTAGSCPSSGSRCSSRCSGCRRCSPPWGSSSSSTSSRSPACRPS
ncbi:Protein NRT1/ PTR FAMILY 4.3 [Dichanthelium oligosanthes]|uniref:Protein NRT1/ PTR FAMILY 4.3 n=1 Tax=Dichanthelium oligosanthes TaxID=888268 RepID=A0A1E5VC09_9POAL|nr:Protein NRT1/ PTR FAMILY 4.3 [Dichanthelium oligosanthes]